MTDQAIPLLPYERMAQLWRIVAEKRTLVHCMTNDVVQGITADLLLAAGASPAMVIGNGREVCTFVLVDDHCGRRTGSQCLTD